MPWGSNCTEWAWGPCWRRAWGPEPWCRTTSVASPQAPVRPHGKDGHRAVAVVGDEDVAPLGVEADVAGGGAVGGLAVERGQAPLGGIDGEGADAGTGALLRRRLVDGVEDGEAGVQGQEGGVVCGGPRAQGGQVAGGGVLPEDADPGGPLGPGVAADVDDHRGAECTAWGWGGSGRGGDYGARRGRRMLTAVPCPSWLSTSTVPPWRVTMCRTVNRPSPLPGMVWPALGAR